MATVRSWRQIVLDADPDWHRLNTRFWVYEFSNGRRFNEHDPVYSFPTPTPQFGGLIDEDTGALLIDEDTGAILTDEDA
jgi:hypothetical protein